MKVRKIGKRWKPRAPAWPSVMRLTLVPDYQAMFDARTPEEIAAFERATARLGEDLLAGNLTNYDIDLPHWRPDWNPDNSEARKRLSEIAAAVLGGQAEGERG